MKHKIIIRQGRRQKTLCFKTRDEARCYSAWIKTMGFKTKEIR